MIVDYVGLGFIKWNSIIFSAILLEDLIFTREKNIDILPNEKVIKNVQNSTIIEITSPNKFDIVQRIMSYSDKCRVLYPESFKKEIIDCLKEMREGYFEEK